MGQGSQNLCATQKQSRAQNKQMTAVRYISDSKEIIKASRSNFHHACAAAFILSQRSLLPPALSAKNLPGEQTQVLNVRRIRRIDRHPTKCDQDSTHQSVCNTQNLFTWNGDLDNPNQSKDNCVADDESDEELDNGIKALECPEHLVVSATQNVPGLI